MIDISEALFKYLSSVPEITDLVGDRIYPVLLPEDCALPAIVYSPVYCDYDSALQGDTGFVRQTMQVVCHANTYLKTRRLSRMVKNAIQDFRGDMEGLNIAAVFIKTDYELSGNTSLKFDTEEYMSSIEFEFHFNEKED